MKVPSDRTFFVFVVVVLVLVNLLLLLYPPSDNAHNAGQYQEWIYLRLCTIIFSAMRKEGHLWIPLWGDENLYRG